MDPSPELPRTNRDSKRAGGRGGKGKDRPPPTRETQVSKKLSWLLRHGATSENLALDTGGYASLADVLANRNLRGMKVSFEEVQEIVRGNDKQRFGMKLASADTGEGEGGDEEGKDETSTKPKDWMIRANQGHSIKVESEGLLEPVTLENMPKTVVHGTSHGAWTQIVASGGLKSMGRNHIHFASGLPSTFKPLSDTNEATTTTPEAAQAPVMSGMRASSTILIYLDLRKALESGIKFWRSENGVILSEGDGEEGKVGLEFFARVEDRTGEGVLVEEGKVVKAAPESWATKGQGGGRGRGRGTGRGGRGG